MSRPSDRPWWDQPDDLVREAKEFGAALKIERKKYGYTQETLAKLVGASQQAVGHWEKGRMLPRASKWARLIQVFGPASLLTEFVERGQIRQQTAEYSRDRERDHHLTGVFDAKQSDSGLVDQPSATNVDRETPNPFLEKKIIWANLRTWLPVSVTLPLGINLLENIGKRIKNRITLDYLSDRLAVDIRCIPEQGVQLTFDLGFHHLNKARLLLGERQPETFVLVLIGPTMAYQPQLRRAYEDASLFNIEVVAYPDFMTACRFIGQAEISGFESCFSEDWSDDSDTE